MPKDIDPEKFAIIPDTKANNTRNPTWQDRTKRECEILRIKACFFMILQSLEDYKKIKELGYPGHEDKDFVAFHKVSRDFIWELQQRSDFKKLYFNMTTAYLSRHLPKYLLKMCSGKEMSNAMKMLFPDEAGSALAVRKIGLMGDADDEDFRNKFFGYETNDKNKNDNIITLDENDVSSKD